MAQEELPSWSLPKNLAWHVQSACELGEINSPEFFVQKTHSVLPIFLAKCGGRLPHEVLRCFMFMFPISNHTE